MISESLLLDDKATQYMPGSLKPGRFRVSILLFSILLSCLTTCGLICSFADESALLTRVIVGNLILTIGVSVALTVLFYIGISLLFKRIDNLNDTQNSEKVGYLDSTPIVQVKKLVKYTAILAFCWSPYLIICSPVITRGYDYFWQLLQGIGIFPLSNHHPVLGSWVFGALFNLGNSLGGASAGFLVTEIVQMTLMAGVLGLCLSSLEMLAVPKKMLIVITLVLCLCPVFPTHALWLIKDSISSSVIILLFFQCFLRAWCLKNKVAIPIIASLPAVVLACFVCSEYRNGVSIIALALLLTMLVYGIAVSDRNKRACRASILKNGSAALALIAMLCGWSILMSSIGVYPTNSREATSMPLRQIARTMQVHPNDLSETERESLIAVYHEQIANGESLTSIFGRYNTFSADGIKADVITERETLLSLMRTWASIGLRHPGCYIDAAVRGTTGYWWLDGGSQVLKYSTETTGPEKDFSSEAMQRKTLDTLFLPTRITLEDSGFDTSLSFKDLWAEYPVLEDVMTVKSFFPNERSALSTFLTKLKEVPVISFLFMPGLYFYVALICFAYLFSRSKEGIVLWPIVLIFFLDCLSPINGYTRYAVPYEILALVMVGICFIPSMQHTILGKNLESTDGTHDSDAFKSRETQ